MKFSLKDLKNIVKIAHDFGVASIKTEGLELSFFPKANIPNVLTVKPSETEKDLSLLMRNADGTEMTPDDMLFYSSEVPPPPPIATEESN